MNMPEIDPRTLPQLDVPTAIFGSLGAQTSAATSDDSVMVMMVYVFQTNVERA